MRSQEVEFVYKSRYGLEVAIVTKVVEPAFNALGIQWETCRCLTGDISYFQDETEARLYAALLQDLHVESGLTIGCEEDPSVWVRDGKIVKGHFAGLPAAYEDGVLGVWLWERFTPVITD
jgi:hypothetical protein